MNKVVSLEEAINLSNKLRNHGKTIVLAGGCFDILHQGHLVYLESAKRQGDILFVALESDENTQRLKGKGRPVNNQETRASALSMLGYVDYVIFLSSLVSDWEYYQMTVNLSPNIIAITKGDPKEKEKRKQTAALGAKLVTVTKRLTQFSTSQILLQQ